MDFQLKTRCVILLFGYETATNVGFSVFEDTITARSPKILLTPLMRGCTSLEELYLIDKDEFASLTCSDMRKLLRGRSFPILKVCVLVLREKGIITELQPPCEDPINSVEVYQGPGNLLDVFPAATVRDSQF